MKSCMIFRREMAENGAEGALLNYLKYNLMKNDNVYGMKDKKSMALGRVVLLPAQDFSGKYTSPKTK